jgi:hypothetical protein
MTWPTTRRFQRTLGSDHFVACRVQLLIGGVATVDLTALGVMADGTIQVENAAVRRSGNVTLVDESGGLLPTGLDALLAPVGSELRFWRGIKYPDLPDPELVPIGTLRFTVTDATWPEISLECYDRGWTIAGAELETDLQVVAGTNVITAIGRVLSTAWGGGLPTNFPNTDEVTQSMIFEAGDDPWEIARELAANIGLVLWFDPMGVCQATPESDTDAATPVWRFDETDDQDLMLPGLKTVWDGTGNNKIIAIGENSDTGAAFRGTWTDNDPASPTRYGGPFGRRPLTIRDEKITSQSQANLRARKEGLRRQGLSQIIHIPSMVHPGLEVGDVVYCSSSRRAVDQLAILERFPVPLRASGSMLLEARARQVVAA